MKTIAIINEKKFVEDNLLTPDVDLEYINAYPYKVANFLIKYYLFESNEDMTTEQVLRKVVDFMQENVYQFSVEDNISFLEKLVKSIFNKGYSLKSIEYIPVTQNDIDFISSKIKDIEAQKLLFTLLCYAKFYNTVKENNNDWCGCSDLESLNLLYTSAFLSKKVDADYLTYDLIQLGFVTSAIKSANCNLQVKINTHDGSKVVHKITDMSNLGQQWLFLVDKGNFCQTCGNFFQYVQRMGRKPIFCSRHSSVKLKIRTCSHCGYKFHVESDKSGIRCPKCGTMYGSNLKNKLKKKKGY